MSKVEIFRNLIGELSSQGSISSEHYELLLLQGKDLGLSQNAVDMMIEMNKSSENNIAHHSRENYGNSKNFSNEIIQNKNFEDVTFRSAITRGGSILTPDILVVSAKSVTYKKRNKHLINVDTVSIPIAKISSVTVDTSIWGTDIIIKSFGSGNITVKRFTKKDAHEIKRLIEERQH